MISPIFALQSYARPLISREKQHEISCANVNISLFRVLIRATSRYQISCQEICQGNLPVEKFAWKVQHGVSLPRLRGRGRGRPTPSSYPIASGLPSSPGESVSLSLSRRNLPAGETTRGRVCRGTRPPLWLPTTPLLLRLSSASSSTLLDAMRRSAKRDR